MREFLKTVCVIATIVPIAVLATTIVVPLIPVLIPFGLYFIYREWND